MNTERPEATALTCGVLLNTGGGRLRKDPGRYRKLTSELPHTKTLEAGNLDEIQTAVDTLMADRVRLLVVAGGDGTMQAVLTRLFTRYPHQDLPRLGIIPGGTTNMNANDIGITGGPQRTLERLKTLLETGTGDRTVSRSVLRICRAEEEDIYGMFFGAGVIASASAYFSRRIRKTGITGELSSLLVMIRFLARLLLGARDGELRPTRIRGRDSQGNCFDDEMLMLFATTLDRLLLGLRPYWGAGDGPVHTTSMQAATRRLRRNLLALALNRGHTLNADTGCFSNANSRLELEMDDDFIVDGEFFRADARRGPLVITATPAIDFVVPGGRQ